MFDRSHNNSNNINRNEAYESARSDAVESDLASLQNCNKSLYVCLVFLSLFLVGGGIALGVTSNASDSATATAKTAAVPQEDPQAIVNINNNNNDSPGGYNFIAPVQTHQEPIEGDTSRQTGAPQLSANDIDAVYPNVQWDSFQDSTSAVNAIAGNVSPPLSSLLSPGGNNSTATVAVAPGSTPAVAAVKPQPLEAVQSPLQDSIKETLSYRVVDFNWTDATKWQHASGAAVPSTNDMFTNSGIRLTGENSKEPLRTIEGWSGEKVVFIEWERTSSSDTNIWMLNTKLQSQFGKANGWPYWGELDLFEMFTQDVVGSPGNDYSGHGSFSDVSSYGQSTLHMGPATENGSPCFCPTQPSKSLWYGNAEPMTSGCTAQFSNDVSNSIAAVWGSDTTGQYIQFIQQPTITEGGKLNGVDTYDVDIGSRGVTSKIYNNAKFFWGIDASEACAKTGGHDAASGFPFFESFRIVLEEQKKNDKSASFTVTNIQIFTKI